VSEDVPNPSTWKAKAKKLAAPVVDRARHEMMRVAGTEIEALRTEIAQLRDELDRQRAEHSAAIAALSEELAASRSQNGS